MRGILTGLTLLFFSHARADGQASAIWTLSARPLVEIGTVEGDANHELFDARSSVRLLDGRIVVLNAGSAELRFFDAQGKFLFKTGARGGGPGEYMQPARLYYTHRDSLIVFDQGNERESHLDTQGRFINGVDGAPVKEDPFRRDTWLYGRMFVDGPALAAERDRIKPALDLLPSLPAPGDYRYVKVDPGHRLWVRENAGAGTRAALQRWTVYTARGQALATVDTPAGFEIQQIGPDFLLGRVRDAMDVEYIRLYGLTTSGAPPARAYFTPASARQYPAPPAPSQLPPPVYVALTGFVRMLAGQQEIHYSKKGAYTSDLTQLTLPDDKNITPHILSASNRGWAVLVIHRDADALCAMAMGSVPVGWSPGRAICGEASRR
ncbi:MAG: 6-bladed beta-propeller [Longimicrobiales bacterium]